MSRKICACLAIFVLYIAHVTALPSSISGTQDLTCFDEIGQGYIGLLPHPANCNMFLNCVKDSTGMPFPSQYSCPQDLKFSFETCVCDWPNTAVCFDPTNPDHNRDKFRCAQRLENTKDSM